MTVLARQRQQRGFPISQGGWGTFMGDPAAIPPPSASQYGTAGVVVNERTVLSLMVVSSCVRILGDTASGLEPHVYRMVGSRRSSEDKEVDPPTVIVNPYADIDREQGDFNRIASHCLNGNAMSVVVDRKGGKTGNPVQVEVLNPSKIRVEMRKGVKTYFLGAGASKPITQQIIHTPWISLAGGLVGLNPIEMGVNGFGIPIASEQYAARYFSQGMHPSGILSFEKPLRKDDAKRVKDELMVNHGGLAQAHAPLVLDSLAKWQQISITPETAQLLETRAFSRGEIGGFYGVPAFLLNDTPGNGGPWGKGLQETVMAYAIFALSGYTRRLDRADTRLLAPGYYVTRRVKEMFATNDQALGTFASMLRQASIASPNDGRELVGLGRTDEPGADSVFAPVASSHSDFLAAGEWGAESGLPGGANPKGSPVGTTEGGTPATPPEGGQP